jgi:hypothetical protein
MHGTCIKIQNINIQCYHTN